MPATRYAEEDLRVLARQAAREREKRPRDVRWVLRIGTAREPVLEVTYLDKELQLRTVHVAI